MANKAEKAKTVKLSTATKTAQKTKWPKRQKSLIWQNDQDDRNRQFCQNGQNGLNIRKSQNQQNGQNDQNGQSG